MIQVSSDSESSDTGQSIHSEEMKQKSVPILKKTKKSKTYTTTTVKLCPECVKGILEQHLKGIEEDKPRKKSKK